MDILIYSFLTNFIYYCAGQIITRERKNDFHSLFKIYFTGVIALSVVSLFLNFFFKLSPNLNSLIYFLIVLIYIIKSRFLIDKKNLNFLLVSSFITFILLIYSNVNRPDAGLYHLPYISLINETKIIFGASNLHFRFGHTSIIQYLSGINLNILFKENGIVIPLASVVSFFYIYFFYDVWKVVEKKDKVDASKFFSLFITVYITYKISRYSSFGNDAVAHLSFFYLISYVLKNTLDKLNINTILLFCVFIFLNKVTLVFCFLIPFVLIIYKYKFNIKYILSLTISPASIILLMWLLKNIFISGCAIYPIKITCNNNLAWTNQDQISKISIQSEAWSKGWPERNNKNISYEEFNKNFNWIQAWSKKHLNYIIKTIFPFVLILLISYLFLLNRNFVSFLNINKDLKIRILLSLTTCIFGTICFFLVFPLYRYGYSLIISLLILIFISLSFSKIQNKKTVDIFKFFLIICVCVFVFKQTNKIFFKERFDMWPNIYTLNLDKTTNERLKIKIKDNFHYYLVTTGDGLCMYGKSPCTSYKLNKKIKHIKKFGYSFLIHKN